MTLGGFAIAIGELVDDAIIDVENVYRRLRENALACRRHRAAGLRRRLRRSREIRSSVVFATAHHLARLRAAVLSSGLEGRCCGRSGSRTSPASRASLLVALTITPVLCMLLLGRQHEGARAEHESFVARASSAPTGRSSTATLRVPIADRARFDRWARPPRSLRSRRSAAAFLPGVQRGLAQYRRCDGARHLARDHRTRSSAASSASCSTTPPSRRSFAARAAPSATSTRST